MDLHRRAVRRLFAVALVWAMAAAWNLKPLTAAEPGHEVINSSRHGSDRFDVSFEVKVLQPSGV